MKGAYYSRHGEPEVVEFGELPDPVAGDGQVIVEVRAVALNHLDLWVRRGLPTLTVTFPHVGGADVAGVIAELGEGVEGWEVGQRVVVNPALWCDECEWCEWGEQCLCESFQILGEHVAGGCAERVAVPARNLMSIPDDFPYEVAAAAPLVYQTAWRALVTRAAIRRGETVLVTGASGGVSTAAIQIAKLADATVFAVTSGPENVERVRQLGADLVVDRLEEDFATVIWRETGNRGVDVVLDSVGEKIWESLERCLAPTGRLVTYGATTGALGAINIRRFFWRQLQVLGTTMASREEFEHVMRLVLEGRLEPVVGQVLPLEEAGRAHELLEAGEVFGKIVLVP